VVVGTGVALLSLVDAAAAAVAPIEIAAGTAMGARTAPVAAVVVAAAPTAWPPAAAPPVAVPLAAVPAAGAWAMVVDAGATVCATAIPVAAMAENRITSLMTKTP
jgi:hypothetical protein